ncbi:E3 ubiquitin-protein ligase znrf2 [Sergentomyia squamirostris]
MRNTTMGVVIGTCIPDFEGGRDVVSSDAIIRRARRQGLYDLKCPFCNKFVLSDDIECHLVMCLTKPRLSYNEDILSDAKGECVICLDDLSPGDVIARLPCLCIYHKGCIDKWFEVNRSCPEHPGD